MTQTTQNSKLIKASPEKIWQAFSNPLSLAGWQAPDGMTARVHHFDFRKGGGYEMSLYYPESEHGHQGKTSEKEDRYSARYKEIVVNQRIVEVIRFDSPDPEFSGEMIMEISLKPEREGTEVTYLFRDIPRGIKPEDNEAGTVSTLEKLARFVEEF